MHNANDTAMSTIAPLQNVSLVSAALERAINRSMHLPGMVVFYGWSGLGKTCASTFAANKFRAYYVEAKSCWSRKAMLKAILKEMGIASAITISDMLEQICEQLAKSGKPLIIDELDHVLSKGMAELVRDIYDGSDAPMLLIGEERVPAKILKESERFHGRVLDWVPAQPPDLDDARHLHRLYCKEVTIKDDLLKRIHEAANNSVRRICVNLDRVSDYALNQGINKIGSQEWGDRELFTGDAKPRRV